MRIDDIAYQRATRIASLGLAVQVAFGLAVLLFGLLAPDSTAQIASAYILIGSIVWLSLMVVFNQHKLERVESLEANELRQQRVAGLGSAFDAEGEEFNVAARRLRLMHKWMMPIASWLIILLLVLMAGWNLFYINRTADRAPVTAEGDIIGYTPVPDDLRGWALAGCLFIAAVSFIMSRFVSGMSKQPAWQNLRGGAGYMVGNALVLLAMATGIVLLYFENDIMVWIGTGICWFMILYALETFGNFLLNLYRPRRPGETPRPAFDSRLLSMLSAPDSIVRSINEAVNYQFGFDITSSWGYRLLMRAAGKLAIFAAVVIVALNCIVIVEPHQQGVVLRGGEVVGDEAHGAGVMFKFPWPIDRAEVHDVTRTRRLSLTAHFPEERMNRNDPILWSTEIEPALQIEPFIVSAKRSVLSAPAPAPIDEAAEAGGEAQPETEQTLALEAVRENFALIETEFVLHYRIREDPQLGLLKFIRFSSDVFDRRLRMTARERTLRDLALREITDYLTGQNLEDIVSRDRAQMTLEMEQLVQQAFDAHETGVEVLNISNPWIRPAGTAAPKFEELAFNIADREQARADAERMRIQQLVATAGGVDEANRIHDAIEEHIRMRQGGATEEQMEAQDQRIAALLTEAGGEAARIIAAARMDQWNAIIGARAQLEEVNGKIAAYRAGPTVYRQFLLMEAMISVMDGATKYIIAMDPERMNIDIELLREDSSFAFEDGFSPEEPEAGNNPQ